MKFDDLVTETRRKHSIVSREMVGRSQERTEREEEVATALQDLHDSLQKLLDDPKSIEFILARNFLIMKKDGMEATITPTMGNSLRLKLDSKTHTDSVHKSFDDERAIAREINQWFAGKIGLKARKRK